MKKICDLEGYENVREIYFVDKKGKIYSKAKFGKGSTGKIRELKQYEKTGGYLNCALVNNDGKTKYHRVHRIVLSAYCKNKEGKPYVNHKDCNRKNNSLENLEWVSPRENNNYSLSKKVFMYNLDGTLENVFESTYEASLKGYNRGHIATCCRNEIKKHKNKIFSYKELTKEEVFQRLSKSYCLKQ
jgi:hypothetical protein